MRAGWWRRWRRQHGMRSALGHLRSYDIRRVPFGWRWTYNSVADQTCFFFLSSSSSLLFIPLATRGFLCGGSKPTLLMYESYLSRVTKKKSLARQNRQQIMTWPRLRSVRECVPRAAPRWMIISVSLSLAGWYIIYILKTINTVLRVWYFHLYSRFSILDSLLLHICIIFTIWILFRFQLHVLFMSLPSRIWLKVFAYRHTNDLAHDPTHTHTSNPNPNGMGPREPRGGNFFYITRWPWMLRVALFQYIIRFARFLFRSNMKSLPDRWGSCHGLLLSSLCLNQACGTHTQ